ncbi:hypothetical protein [Williamsia sp. D3]|uniref:hypothetical protein n=1 Tax=Williamsia sp. D3 TaxID=1313067 RepID=UPI0003D3713D|nr:hypothetical protein [Williamsia sp. D3]ETD32290.1 hypothetical protein W823_14355 [Williamsia sp. D3]PZT97171.1 MAG: hypothetical protein DI630_22190 [Gordonia sp. (in: high G+C Gram-positive bacteria)]
MQFIAATLNNGLGATGYILLGVLAAVTITNMIGWLTCTLTSPRRNPTRADSMILELLICGATLLSATPILFVCRRAWHMADRQVPPPVLRGARRHSDEAKK